MAYFANIQSPSHPQASPKIAKARSEIAHLSEDQLRDAGIDTSGIPCNPTFAVDARTMTSLMSLR